MSHEGRFIRQSGLVDASILKTQIVVIGAGGIGSFTTLALAKMGFEDITVWDYDMVEEHNLPNQFYPSGLVGQAKVSALARVVKDFTDIEISTVKGEYKGEPINGLVVMAVDSMSARKLIFDSNINREECIGFIDGRMGGNQLEVYSVLKKNTLDARLYKRTLCTDAKAADVRCTEKAVMYNVLTIASWVANQARLMLSDKEYKRALILDLENMILVIPESKKK
jgi:molybdopterin/thiamine biosynthesis adenylyltransferase